MFRCPATGYAISTGIEIDRGRFSRSPVFIGHTKCPLCKTEHEWFARDVWVSEVDLEAARSSEVGYTTITQATRTSS